MRQRLVFQKWRKRQRDRNKKRKCGGEREKVRNSGLWGTETKDPEKKREKKKPDSETCTDWVWEMRGDPKWVFHKNIDSNICSF